MTLTFTVDPNATIKVYQGTAAAAAANDLVANAGSYTVAAGSAADQVITIGVTNNGTTWYYKLTLDCDN